VLVSDLAKAPAKVGIDSLTQGFSNSASTRANGGIGEGGSPNNTDIPGAYKGSGSLSEAGAAPSFSALEADGMDVQADGWHYLDLVAKSTPDLPSKTPLKNESLDPLARECGAWALVGRCRNGHAFAAKLYCGREWCSECREQVHRRRIARWLPKAQQLESMGYWDITFPPELRLLLRNKVILRKVSKKAVAALRSELFVARCGKCGHVWGFGITKASHIAKKCPSCDCKKITIESFEGFPRGLRRWHWFGDTPGVYNPHLNIIVEGKYLRGEKLEATKQAIRRALLPPAMREHYNLVINYSYTKAPGKMYHILKYVTRATFLDYTWDDCMASRLWNFRNTLSWGKWEGPEVWPVHTRKLKLAAASELQQNRCPTCGEAIVWQKKPVDSTWLLVWGARDIGAGYYQLPDIRPPPG